jgi:hypothetical protein
MQVCGIDPSSKPGSIGISVIRNRELILCEAVDFERCLEIAWDVENQVVFIETYRTKGIWLARKNGLDPKSIEVIATNVGIGIGAMICFAGFIATRANVRKVYPCDTKLCRKRIFELTGYDTSSNENARDSFMVAYHGYELAESELLAMAKNGGEASLPANRA